MYKTRTQFSPLSSNEQNNFSSTEYSYEINSNSPKDKKKNISTVFINGVNEIVFDISLDNLIENKSTINKITEEEHSFAILVINILVKKDETFSKTSLISILTSEKLEIIDLILFPMKENVSFKDFKICSHL